MTRVAVLNKDKCKPGECLYMCIKACPKVRAGVEVIKAGEDTKPVISEALCIGCGICVKKCPYGAIDIINLPQEMENPIHQYGENAFRLYKLPTPKFGAVVGIIGANGVGKTTAMKILSGELQPNLGYYKEREVEWKDIIKKFAGEEQQTYLTKLSEKKIRTAYKPQYVDQIPNLFKGKVKELLEKTNENKKLDGLVSALRLETALDRQLPEVSGGELQKIACAATMLKNAELYIFDEPSSYLDVRERLNLAKAIRGLAAEGKAVLVVEHDLIVLDYLADYVNILYGKPCAYGIVSKLYSVRNGINIYLKGFLPEENVRFRDTQIEFREKQAGESKQKATLLRYTQVNKNFENFRLEVKEGEIIAKEVLGILGPNATGKTTFVKILAGVIKADIGEISQKCTVSYKPQYLEATTGTSVFEVLSKAGFDKYRNAFLPLQLDELTEHDLASLSGGELQRVAIAECLSKDADIYLLDEPSAHMDVEQRIAAAKIIRNQMIEREKTALVVDHDLLFADYLSDRLMVFSGEAGKHGVGNTPESMSAGMNRFLKGLEITFRRDPDTKRPRANKPGSQKDKEQKKSGEYYYTR